jgi:ribosomal protein S18 acetylase RimI-like enzyme
MDVKILSDKKAILEYLEEDSELQIYSIGDLDDFYIEKTTWFGLVDNNEIRAIALLYSSAETPTLIALNRNTEPLALLLGKIKQILPEKFYAHLSPGLINIFGEESIIENFGLHYKMILKGTPEKMNDPAIRRLTCDDEGSAWKFYKEAYPGTWFDSRMLETGKYFGYYSGETLVGIAGAHVYSPEYGVAALGNIAVHPDFRGSGICYKLTSVLCNDFSDKIRLIGLNVKSDNEPAIRCYQKAGFTISGEYEEYLFRNSVA